eukprot:CAMPEP_0194219830 /NCGR_PEP_ID=MMETSP0156-20130528/26960_1 /TAXON_ID=33649 /ORGANISM="Thalassionema nitzschioides, Strain L26-B" /LENGTH=34 /DNA_ID= /DNA_START= /DNA_END= /DNA_ORIENTATION=
MNERGVEGLELGSEEGTEDPDGLELGNGDEVGGG